MRHNRAVRLAAATIIWCGLFSRALAQLPQELVAVYRPAVERLRQAYSQATIEGTSVLVYPRQDKSREQEFVMRASGKLRRLDVKTVRQKNMGLEVGSSEMRMATPWGSLSTYTAAGHNFFDDAKQIPYGDIVAQIDRQSLVNYPYSLDASGTILDMLLSPSVKVTSVNNVRADDQPLVRISYQQQGTFAGQSGVWRSSVVLSPSEGWACRGFTRTLSQGLGTTQRASLTYSGMQGGIPQLETIEAETLSGSAPLQQETIQVSEIKFGKPDSYYFDSWSF